MASAADSNLRPLLFQVDPSGPLANLKRFFSGEGMASFKEWLTAYWYVVLAAGLLLLVLLVSAQFFSFAVLLDKTSFFAFGVLF